jgi:ankyrin repeat protein
MNIDGLVIRAQSLRRAVSSVAVMMLIATAWSTCALCAEIHEAAKRGDLAKVKELLKDKPELVSAKDENGDTPLHWASGFEAMAIYYEAAGLGVVVYIQSDNNRGKASEGVAELLLSNHADVNAKDDKGVTPLIAAAFGGHADVEKLLLANKAEVNAKDHGGRTALHYAAEFGHQDVAELLLSNKADADAHDNQGATPLIFAAIGCHGNLIELLLANHADVNAKTEGEYTALHIATVNCHANHPDVLDVLRSHGGRE